MNTTPIVLVPGFWLGAWAWDEVAAALRAAGIPADKVQAEAAPTSGASPTDRVDIQLMP